MVVGQFTSFGRETKIGHRGYFEILNFEALRPFIFLLVLEIELERLVGKIGEAGFGRNPGVANTSSLAII